MATVYLENLNIFWVTEMPILLFVTSMFSSISRSFLSSGSGIRVFTENIVHLLKARSKCELRTKGLFWSEYTLVSDFVSTGHALVTP